jgi:hypothetical protein
MSGIIHMVNQTPIQWFCKKQNVVETATYGSEFMVARQATEQIMDLRYTLRMLGIPIEGPAWLFGDNQSVITSSTIPHSCLNKRHNALSYHRVREALAAEILYFLHMDGKYNPSDILTKFLNWAKFCPLVQPMLFWKGETSKQPRPNFTITQMIEEIKTAALPSGFRGVTSGDGDVPLHEHNMVNPSDNACITSCTLSVSSHPKMSSIGQELSSGEQSQYRDLDTAGMVVLVCPSVSHDQVPPGTDVLQAEQYVVTSAANTLSTMCTGTVPDSHTIREMKVQPSSVSTDTDSGSESVQYSTDSGPGSKWILVGPKQKSKI